MDKIAKQIKDWLTSYVTTNHVKGFVVGVSGGIDSAVVSTLCAETGLPTILVTLPIKNQVGSDLALRHINLLKESYKNVSYIDVNLSKTYKEFLLSFNDNYESGMLVDDKEIEPLALANSQARLRMTTLYYIAQINNMLVVGTGNKVEDFGIGFFTKYGDGGVDISPIADLMKSEVVELGRYLGVIPDIVNAKPTDGLWTDGRTDEDQIGATYNELEWAMNYLGTGIEDPFNEPPENRKEIVLNIYKDRHSKNVHKMIPIPICKIEK
jgi:NAD+ synthase